MNRFIIDEDPDSIARALCDQHVVKMPLEEAQMLCTALWHHAPEYAEENDLYKPVHQKHPCTLWAMKTRYNFRFAYNLYCAMLREYTYRYGKCHGAGKHRKSIAVGIGLIPKGNMKMLTVMPQCFGDHKDLKTTESYPLEAYRKFYKKDKMGFARWNKNRSMPNWLL
tara:strand:+ start:309 stop:809 length:501 start_codon:yes stop_codon:yes gene_type:complete